MKGKIMVNKILAVRKDGLSMLMCVDAVIKQPSFTAAYDRLAGSNLSMKGSNLDLMIDKASGRQAAEIKEFIDFVYEHIFLLTPPIA